MATKMPWFRLYSEILDDKKIKRICRATSFNKATVIGVWVCLLALANESTDRGSLQISDGIPYDINDLVAETELPEDQLDTLLKMFERYDMLHFDSKEGWSILNWNGRQFKSDNVAVRVAKHRERKAQEEVKRYSNVIDTDTDTESDTDTETGAGNIDDIDRSPLLELFERETKIIQPSELIDAKGFMSWEKEIAKWETMGAEIEDVKAAIKKADELKSNLSWPGSVTKYMASGIARRERGVSNDPAPNNGKHGPAPYPEFGTVYVDGIAYNAKGEVISD